MRTRIVTSFAVVFLAFALNARLSAATMGITADGRYFTIDGKPTFLLGQSYYGAQSIGTPASVTQDLDDMAADGFNWIRVWGYWSYNDVDWSVLTHDGNVRTTYMSRLKTLITECNSRGIMVDVSLNRDGNGDWVGARNQSEHLQAVRTLATELLAYRNVYFDVSNERDVRDDRYVSLADCGQLIDAVKAIDPTRPCTASSTPTSQSELSDFKNVAHMDFIAPHLCRDAGCPAQTEGTVQRYIGWMNNLGWRMPIHLQEPFRRGYGSWTPGLDDFLTDAKGAKDGEAAGWCLHNGSNSGGRPYRCFDMRDTEGRLYTQYDSVERQVCDKVFKHIGGVNIPEPSSVALTAIGLVTLLFAASCSKSVHRRLC